MRIAQDEIIRICKNYKEKVYEVSDPKLKCKKSSEEFGKFILEFTNDTIRHFTKRQTTISDEIDDIISLAMETLVCKIPTNMNFDANPHSFMTQVCVNAIRQVYNTKFPTVKDKKTIEQIEKEIETGVKLTDKERKRHVQFVYIDDPDNFSALTY